MRYDPGRDLGWLLLRPWVAIPRLIHVLWSLACLLYTSDAADEV